MMKVVLNLSDRIIEKFCKENEVSIEECKNMIKLFYEGECEESFFESKLEEEIMNY